MISPCPNCGCQETSRCGQAGGTVIGYYNHSGFEEEIETSNLWFLMSKTVRCQDCGKIRRDLVFAEGKVQPKEGN